MIVIDTVPTFFYYAGATLAAVCAGTLMGVFIRKWGDPIFRSLTVYFAGVTGVNVVALMLESTSPGALYPYLRAGHGILLLYVMLNIFHGGWAARLIHRVLRRVRKGGAK